MVLNGVVVPKMSHVFLDGVTVIQTTNVMALSFAEATIAKTTFLFPGPSGTPKQIAVLVRIITANKKVVLSIFLWNIFSYQFTYNPYVIIVKKCYCEYENGGKVHGSELGIMCSTTGQWVREYHCKAANYAENSFGEFCTGPHEKDKAVKWENRIELCSPGIMNLFVTLSWLRC